MKVETAKSYQADKKDTNDFKTDTNLFKTDNQIKTIESISAQQTGAFARILDEARKQDDKDKNNSSPVKNDSTEKNSKTSKSEADAKINRQTNEKKELEERNHKHESGRDGQHKDEENQLSAIMPPALQFETKPVSENSAPASRQMLHIADLERIISTIRAESFQNEKQVTIALKNSILEGLQIKLTITENGKLKAEFLALNEQIKKQLNLRKKELSAILRNRSALFAEVQISSQNNPEKKLII